MNKLYYGDNLDVLRKYIKDESVDLCYIDPPFNSKRNYNQIYNNIGAEDTAQAQVFLDTWTWDEAAEHGFEEIISNYGGVFTAQSIELILGFEKVLGKGSLLSYLISMTLRIAEIYRVLKLTGCFYLHCDPTASHYLKLLIDAVFCAGRKGQFITEIIWTYSWGVRTDKRWNKKHDVIFCYAKTNEYVFNAYEVLEPRTLGESSRNRLQYAGALIESKNKTGSKEFALPSDVWYIPTINGMAKERLGYPTQKPEELLEKIIKASSNPGDTVLDAYCGCGTTVAVAERLHRNWIGIDITYQSISLILKRLEDTFGNKVLENIELNGVPKDFNSAIALAEKKEDKTRKEFEKWFVLTYTNNRAVINEKKGGDEGIDGIAFVMDMVKGKQEYPKVLFSVKSNRTLSPTVIRDLNGTMERDGAVAGYLLTLYPMENMVKESKKYGTYKNSLYAGDFPKIQVISVQEMLDGIRFDLPSVIPGVVKSAEKKGKGGKQDTLL